MNTEPVIDASVLVKCLITEPNSAIARREVAAASRLVAPDFILIEIASIAAKKVRRGDIPKAFGAQVIDEAEIMLGELVPSAPLIREAFNLSASHGVSVYDGLYLALAMQRDSVVLTADLRLMTRVGRAGLDRFVHALPDA